MSRVRLLGVLVAMALAAAACTSSGDDDDDAAATDDAGPETSSTAAPDASTTAAPETTAASTTLAPRTASFRGVTEDTIEVGVVVSDLDELRELGLVDINRGDEELVWQTFFDDLNDRGGINGRTVDMTWAPYNPVQETSANEACIVLTEDVGVFATLGGVRGPAATVNACFLDDHETIMVGGIHTPEGLATARAPWISDQMSADRKYTGGIGIMADEGLLDGTVGIIYDSSEEALYEDVIAPALAAVGVEPVVGVQDIPPGDLSAAQALFPVILERFEAEGVDTIMLVQAAMNLGVGILLDNGFDGQIIGLDPTGQVAALGGYDERLPSAFDGVIGITGASPDEKWDLPATQDCVATFEAANPDIDVVDSREVPEGGPDWAVPVIEACRHLALFEVVATNAGVDLTNESFAAGLEGLGTFVLAGQPFNSLSPDKLDADDALRLGVFDSTLGDEGDLAPLTELQDIG